MGVNRFKQYKQDFIYINLSDSETQDTILTSNFAGITYPTSHIHVYQKALKYDVFEYIQAGRMCIKHNGHKYIANAGDIYILKRGAEIEYHTFGKEKVTKLWFNMKGTLIDKLRTVYNLDEDVIVATADVEKDFYDIHLLFQTKICSFELTRQMSLNIHNLLMKVSVAAKKSNIIFEPSCELAEKVKNYIDSKLYYYTTLKIVAEYFFTTDKQIIRVFKSKYGITPYAYMLQKRIETAKTLLCNTNISIKEIAEKLCFANGGYFTKIFKKHVGITPTAYREKLDRT